MRNPQGASSGPSRPAPAPSAPGTEEEVGSPLRPAWLVLLLLLAAACSGPARPAPVLDERHVITVDGNTVRYNGRLLDWNGTVKDWEKVLGPASRIDRETPAISVWDDLGVFLYHGFKGPTPRSFVVLLSRTPPAGMEPHAFWPRRPFPGRLVVDGGLIHAGSTPGEIVRVGSRLRSGYLPSVYDFESTEFYLRLDYARSDLVRDFSISHVQDEPPRAKAGRKGTEAK